MDLDLRVERGEAAAYADMFRAAPASLAEALGVQVLAIGDAMGLMVAKIDAAEFNRVLGLGLDQPARPEHLDEIVARYRPLGLRRARFQLSPHAEPRSELPRWLAERGMAKVPGGWTKRARSTQDLPEVVSDLAVIDAADAPGEFGRIACAGFGMPPPLAAWLDALVGRPDWRCFLAVDGGQPVSAGALFLGDGFGWLGIGASLPQARGRGGQGLLMRHRIEAARTAGAPWAITETGAPGPGEQPGPSYRNMERYGFHEVCLRPNYAI